MNSTLKKILIAVVVIAVIVVIIILISNRGQENRDLLRSSGSLAPSQTLNDKSQASNFLQSLSEVKSIELDTTIFENKVYQKLVDFSVPITLNDQRLIGRPNPFAPIGVDAIFNQPTDDQSSNGPESGLDGGAILPPGGFNQ